MSTVTDNVEASLLNFCMRFAEALNLAIPEANFRHVALDTYASEDDLPQTDLIGPNHIVMELDEHLLEVECVIGVATHADGNSFRVKKAGAYLFDQLRPTTVLPYLDAETGVQLGNFTVMNGTRAMPVGGDQRPTRFFIIRLKLDQAIDLRAPGLLI